MLRGWLVARGATNKASFLVERNLAEVAAGRREEIAVSDLRPGAFVAHQEFTVAQGDKDRACNNCTASG